MLRDVLHWRVDGGGLRLKIKETRGGMIKYFFVR